MRGLRAFLARLLTLIRQRNADDDFASELESHVAMHTEDGIRAGLSQEEARRRALVQIGGAEQVRQAHRDRRTLPWLESVLQDTHYAARRLRNSPGFTFAAVSILALGIGANAAIFTVFDNVLLRNLPVHDPDRLILLGENSRFETGRLNVNAAPADLTFAWPAYQALRSAGRDLCDLAAFSYGTAIVTTNGSSNYINMQLVSGNYFSLLGVQPVLGRLLTSADDQPYHASSVVILSQEYWRTRFGADPSILDRTLSINGQAFTIVGVVPHQGVFPGAPAEIFLPITLASGSLLGNYTSAGRMNVLRDPLNRWMNIVGRLSPGATQAQAEARLNTAWWNWRREALRASRDNILDKAGWLQTHLSVTSGGRGISLLAHDFGEPLRILQTMALVLLLIACANLANLLLARAARRQGEIAVRGALGATRRRVVQQLTIEGLLLGLIGAAAGLALAWLGLRALLIAVPAGHSLHSAIISGVDTNTLVFCAAVGVMTSVVFSLAPAMLSIRVDLLRALHMQNHALTMGGQRLRNLMVASEIALSCVLVAGAAVFGWNLYQLRNTNPGFATSHVLTFRVDIGRTGRNSEQFQSDLAGIDAALQGQSGVSSVAYSANGLISGWTSGGNITVAGYSASRADQITPDRDWVSPSFFSTMQIPLLVGRTFTSADTQAAEKVAIVDQAFVRHFFRGNMEAALGGQFGFGGGDNVKTDIQIIGVTLTVRATSLTSAPPVPFFYLPYAQHYGSHPSSPASFYVRTVYDPSRLAVAARSIVHRTDPALILSNLQTMQQHLSDLTYGARLVTMLSLLMGALALLLAAIGLQGLLMLAVAQRTREFGIRIALGADRTSIFAVVLALLCRVAVPGVAAGVLVGWAGVRELLHHDADLVQTPVTIFLAAGALLVAVMALAAFMPARHAVSVDPMQALRTE
ncbi:MAG TPA: ADOP family duplicated permease [Terracidiphilus sp.]